MSHLIYVSSYLERTGRWPCIQRSDVGVTLYEGKKIKDPQLNYILAQAYLSSAGPLKAALLIDLAKAFERVNLDWLHLLLTQYGAPKWLINYFSCTTSSRVTIPKITNRLAPPHLTVRWA